MVTEHQALQVRGTGVARGWFGGSPPGELLKPLELRALVLDESTPLQVRDTVWRHIVERVRDEGEDWYLVAFAAAYPGLYRAAWRLRPGRLWPASVIRDVHRRITIEFFGVLSEIKPDGAHRLDITRPHVASRAIGQARDHTKAYFERQVETRPAEDDYLEKAIDAAWQAFRRRDHTSAPPRHPAAEHPDVTLADLVAATAGNKGGSRLTAQDAELAARTRYEYTDAAAGGLKTRTIPAVADELGIPRTAAMMRHKRALDLIAALLGHTRTPATAPEPPAGN
ncbi:hypothetical protein [Longispora albida]|uniref:hypothetical protein n=1 Tax=Longispora albida TaxID=203523 RepID=UPI00036FECA1|nr:hypothetical protein [Longispora albida]